MMELETISAQSKYCDASTQTVSTKTLETFTIFPTLPLELQLEIWKNSLPERRVVEFRATRYREEDAHIRYNLPVILHVCQNSRQMALKRYKLVEGLFEPIYFDFEEDIAYFFSNNWYPLLAGLDSDIARQLRYVALAEDCFGSARSLHAGLTGFPVDRAFIYMTVTWFPTVSGKNEPEEIYLRCFRRKAANLLHAKEPVNKFRLK